MDSQNKGNPVIKTVWVHCRSGFQPRYGMKIAAGSRSYVCRLLTAAASQFCGQIPHLPSKTNLLKRQAKWPAFYTCNHHDPFNHERCCRRFRIKSAIKACDPLLSRVNRYIPRIKFRAVRRYRALSGIAILWVCFRPSPRSRTDRHRHRNRSRYSDPDRLYIRRRSHLRRCG